MVGSKGNRVRLRFSRALRATRAAERCCHGSPALCQLTGRARVAAALVASRPSALRRISMADNYDDDEFEDYDEGAHAGYSHRPA